MCSIEAFPVISTVFESLELLILVQEGVSETDMQNDVIIPMPDHTWFAIDVL
jgi:hypothetical protein